MLRNLIPECACSAREALPTFGDWEIYLQVNLAAPCGEGRVLHDCGCRPVNMQFSLRILDEEGDGSVAKTSGGRVDKSAL